MQLTKCPISNVDVEDAVSNDTFYQYSITFNGHRYTFKLAVDSWDDNAQNSLRNNWILQGMLFNNEWDIDQDVILTPSVITQVTRLGEYPRNFDEKLNYFVCRCYQDGGAEYKSQQRNYLEYSAAYATNSDEYNRIFDGLFSKKLIRVTDNLNEFVLAEKGVEFAKQLLKTKKLDEPIVYNGNGPKLYIFSTLDDKVFADKLQKTLLGKGSTVGVFDNIVNDGFGSDVHNARNCLYDKDCDFAIFIKSANSDQNNAFGSILDIAIEIQSITEKGESGFVYLAYIDDSTHRERPRLIDYSSTSFDFRIISNRNRLVKSIQTSWEHKKRKEPLKRLFNFPTLSLNASEKKWLELVYQKLIANEKFDITKLLAINLSEFPKDFDPEKISHLLFTGGHITLYGIWNIHPESDLLEKFDNVIFAIKKIIETGNVTEIESKEIQAIQPNVTSLELLQIIDLMYPYGFNRGNGTREDFSSTIHISGKEVFNQYRNYSGLQAFLDNYLQQNSTGSTPESSKPIPPLINTTIKFETIDSFKTAIAIRDSAEVKPVLGVSELAGDLAEIIYNLPLEKGQMIGVFGKWGRGKTFFINELWKVIKSHTIQYTRIEYPAWKYQETPASWAYLYELFAENYLGKKDTFKSWRKYYARLIYLNFKRAGLSPFIDLGLIFVATITTCVIIVAKEQSHFLIPGIPILLALGGHIGIKMRKQFSTKATDLIKKYGTHHSFKEKMGVQADIHTELTKMLKIWIPEKSVGKEKIILIVEDIDRCNEEKILQNIDALRVMLDDEDISKRVIIVAAIDERILKNAIRVKYNSLITQLKLDDTIRDKYIPELVSEYLDKIFISAIKLGELSDSERNEFLEELIKLELASDTLNNIQEEDKIGRIKNNFTSIPPELVEKMIDDPGFMTFWNTFHEQEDPISQTGEKYDLAIVNGDFAIKDGDLAIEDSKGNITSQHEILNTLNSRLNNQNKTEKLSTIEVRLLKKHILGFKTATPRKIRIFYYRYLLCKNLLINRYSGSKRINIWQNEKGIEIMLATILKYTLLHNPDEISRQKVSLLNFNPTDEITVEDITVLQKDYFDVLQVLEFVIAY